MERIPQIVTIHLSQFTEQNLLNEQESGVLDQLISLFGTHIGARNVIPGLVKLFETDHFHIDIVNQNVTVTLAGNQYSLLKSNSVTQLLVDIAIQVHIELKLNISEQHIWEAIFKLTQKSFGYFAIRNKQKYQAWYKQITTDVNLDRFELFLRLKEVLTSEELVLFYTLDQLNDEAHDITGIFSPMNRAYLSILVSQHPNIYDFEAEIRNLRLQVSQLRDFFLSAGSNMSIYFVDN